MFTTEPRVNDDDLSILLDALSAEAYKVRENTINFIVSMSKFGGKVPTANAADVAKAVDMAFSGATLKGMFIYPKKVVTVNNVEIDKGFNVRVDGEIVLRNLYMNSFYELFDTVVSDLLIAKRDAAIKVLRDSYKVLTDLKKTKIKASAWADGPYDKAVTSFFNAALKGAKPKEIRGLLNTYDLVVEITENNLPRSYGRSVFTFVYSASDDKYRVLAPKEIAGKKYGDIDDMVKDLVAVFSSMTEGIELNTFRTEWARKLLEGS